MACHDQEICRDQNSGCHCPHAMNTWWPHCENLMGCHVLNVISSLDTHDIILWFKIFNTSQHFQKQNVKSNTSTLFCHKPFNGSKFENPFVPEGPCLCPTSGCGAEPWGGGPAKRLWVGGPPPSQGTGPRKGGTQKKRAFVYGINLFYFSSILTLPQKLIRMQERGCGQVNVASYRWGWVRGTLAT